MEELLQKGSTALKKLATNQRAKQYLESNTTLYHLVRKAADRYIGGETLDETIVKVQHVSSATMKCSIEFMGENIRTGSEAIAAKSEFVRICNAIKSQRLNASIALDLSHIGLEVSHALCLNNLLEICGAAEAADIEVIISAEATHQTHHVINMYREAATQTHCLGITLQAYLYRTPDDFKELIKLPGRIRIVKGAFGTAPGLSMPRGPELNDVYLQFIEELLRSKHKCAIATHDDIIQQQAKTLVDLYGPDKSHYEFESLYGIQADRLERLMGEGYMTKTYFVYGTQWFLYLSNRISEYPLNIFQALADMQDE